MCSLFMVAIIGADLVFTYSDSMIMMITIVIAIVVALIITVGFSFSFRKLSAYTFLKVKTYNFHHMQFLNHQKNTLSHTKWPSVS